LAAYLKSKGADISDADAEASLSEIVSASDVLWKEGTNEAGAFVMLSCLSGSDTRQGCMQPHRMIRVLFLI